jgi:squalene synthase HpnC
MSETAFASRLAENGPLARADGPPPTLAAARAYCRRLARGHYENFVVGSLLLPRWLREHFYAVYAFCRWADDLADETHDPAQGLELLAWWSEQLEQCYRGAARHPVFVALADTVRRFDIPSQPFEDLLSAFRQDQRVARYATVADLLDYCRRSANPVGRIVLHLGRACDPERAALADSICTGLQWANFCQDVAGDWRRGRVYLPRESLEACGCGEAELALGRATPAARRLVLHEARRAREFLEAGRPLIELAPRALSGEVFLFLGGGLAILDELERRQGDVWSRRPTVPASKQLALVGRAWWRARRPRFGAGP